MASTQSCTTNIGNQLVIDIISAVADAEDRYPLDLQPPLNEVIDVDSLAQIIESADDEVTVRFEYREWNVEVISTGNSEVVVVSDD